VVDVATVLVAPPGEEVDSMMHWYGDGMSGWGYLLMAVNTVVFWGLVAAGVVVLFRYLGRTPDRSGGSARPTAEQVLAERFARGEIDEEEYRRRLETLRSHAGTPAGS
jgi:putative membrane protein